MAIETLEDYNAQACCCPQLLCPIPEEIVQTAVGVAGVTVWGAGTGFTDNAGTRYLKGEYGYEGCSRVVTMTLGGHHDFYFPDDTEDLANQAITDTDNGVDTSGCGDILPTVYSDPITWADWIAEAENELDTNYAPLDELEDWAEAEDGDELRPGSGGTAHIVSDVEYIPGALDLSFLYEKQWLRVFWKIPASWDGPSGPEDYLGNYFLITFNVVEDVYDPENPGTILEQSFIDNPDAGEGDDPKEWVVEWTGPGSGDADDPSWLTEIVKIPPPTGTGRIYRRIVNRRLVCREDWGLGILPQVWGEAVELEEP